jgi:hypothetical protein
MLIVRGDLRAGEASATSAAVGKRQRGAIWTYYALLFASMAAGSFIGWIVDLWLHSDLRFLGIVIGSVGYLIVGRRWTLIRFRGRMEARGLPTKFPLELSITKDVLKYQVSDISKEAPWRSVTELFHSKGYWIFLVQTEPWFAPSKFFASQADEKSFVTEALLHLSEEARGRSTAAIKFSQSAA